MTNLNFFGSTFRKTLLFVVFLELVSFLHFLITPHTDFMNWSFIIVSIVIAAVTIHKLKYGLYIAIAELIIGSKGYLFFYEVNEFQISIRLAIFVIIMVVFGFSILQKQKLKQLINKLNQHKELYILAAVCLLGLIIGYVNQNQLTNIFFDFNAWLYFLYILPFLYKLNKKSDLNKIIQIFTAGITFVAVKSLLFLYLLSHQVSFIRNLYKWGRDTGFGEFTAVSDSVFRIFSQGQIFILIGFFIFLSVLILREDLNYKKKLNQKILILLFLFLSVIILSLSRSFWLSLALTGLMFLLILIKPYRFRFKNIGFIILKLIVLTGLAYSLIIGIIYIPFPSQGEIDAGSMIKNRFNLNESAVSSRWSQLPELTSKIKENPIFGSGFGATITYNSQDPRILTEENPEGKYTTFILEWGYLDLIFELGLLGIFAYLYLLFSILKKYYHLWKQKTDHFNRALIIGFVLGLFSLMIVHVFTPYLNHPLGIGYLLIMYVVAMGPARNVYA